MSDNQNVIRDVLTAGASLLAAGASVYMVWRVFAGPDAEKSAQMWFWDKIRTAAQKRETHWHNVAQEAYSNYSKLTLV